MEKVIKELQLAYEEKIDAQKALVRAGERRRKAHYRWLKAKDDLTRMEHETLQDFELHRHE